MAKINELAACECGVIDFEISDYIDDKYEVIRCRKCELIHDFNLKETE